MVVVNLEGEVVEGDYRPSSDTPTHVVLYNRFQEIGGVVHTHSPWATSWAQAGRGIPCYGTTHADYLYGQVPCVRTLTKEEIETAYEKHGVLIADEFERLAVDYIATPAVLCKIMVHSRGERMRKRQCTTQWSWKKLPKWRHVVSRSIRR